MFRHNHVIGNHFRTRSISFTSTPSCEPETGSVKEEADDGAVGEVRTETASTDWADADTGSVTVMLPCSFLVI